MPLDVKELGSRMLSVSVMAPTSIAEGGDILRYRARLDRRRMEERESSIYVTHRWD